MGVHQTREFFLQRDGYISDNPRVGPTLTEGYWKCGNSEQFLDLVERLTCKPMIGDAWVNDLKKSTEELLEEEKARDDAKRTDCVADNESQQCIDLSMRIRIVDGDVVLADTEVD